MTTLKAIAREMLNHNAALGRAEAVASLATTTVTVSALAVGSLKSNKFVDQWLMRRDAANTADRVRRCSAFAASTGVLTHAGTNYADTTATGETVEILPWEPYRYDIAINQAVQKILRRDEEIIPARQGVRRYWLGDFGWLDNPARIMKVGYSGSPILTRNRYFGKWNTVNSSGVLQPDSWTLSGASATMARSQTQVDPAGGPYSVAITRAGTNCLLSQNVGLLESGVSTDSMASEQVTGVARVWSAVASQVRVQVYDGVDTTSSSYHTGGSGWEELTVAHTVNAAATELTVRLSVESDNTVCYAGQLYGVHGTISDEMRRDRYPQTWLQRDAWGFDQGGTVLSLDLPEWPRGRQITLVTHRPYPGFDATRLSAGSADADTSDAPVTVAAVGAIGELYRGLAMDENAGAEKRKRYEELHVYWRERFEELATAHLGFETPGNTRGVPVYRGVVALPRRVR